MCTFSVTVKFTLTLVVFTNIERRLTVAGIPSNVGKAPVTLVATNLLTVTFVKFSKVIWEFVVCSLWWRMVLLSGGEWCHLPLWVVGRGSFRGSWVVGFLSS